MTLQYAILDKAAWDHQTERLADCPGAAIVGIDRLGAAVQLRTGRAHVLAIGSVGRKLRAGNRVYVAPDRNPLTRGVLVQKVTT